jgi:hypothetical protein
MFCLESCVNLFLFCPPICQIRAFRAFLAMEAGGLDGSHASPKGLPHGFGVAAVSAGIPR